jgi:hypothetical protein
MRLTCDAALGTTLHALMDYFQEENFGIWHGSHEGIETLQAVAMRRGDETFVKFSVNLTPGIRPDADVGLNSLYPPTTTGDPPMPTIARVPYCFFHSLIITKLAITLEMGNMELMKAIVLTALEQAG